MDKARSFFIYVLIFVIGGLSYCFLELLFRGRTHLSMFFAGGASAVMLHIIATKSSAPAWKKWIVAGAAITTMEFIVGAVVNLRMRLAVWDYSHMPMNLLGQISLQFSVLWVVLAIPVIWLFERIQKIYNTKRGRSI